MVSLRKRRLLNCCGPTSFITPLPFLTSEEYTTGVRNPDAEVYKNRGPIEGTLPPIEYPEENSKIKEVFYPPIPRPLAVKVEPVSSNDSGSFSLKELQHISAFSVTDPPNQEPCSMRGVYFKNMEWVAAIEVDKKQIHLGTFSSREEAARLYDRAAFLCGKEPNFELSEEEKRELRTQSWDEFLADKNTEKSIHMGSMETSTSEPKAERGESSSS
ncbi:PREDICTED: ethylene-responsive transcription factor-like protein At4g13040 [Tarenaya hassleriana]|uniref:ethylene-responsive transcription factor-like protein At4g13040 n=1 Tax=Tarenaya hassleriana TaxID=28532 RepID=UPI00053C2D6D|nr:PREDICTED: ethylene-responsive transcription factor-like protein At4g13040 [Tarenaya hassleriana]